MYSHFGSAIRTLLGRVYVFTAIVSMIVYSNDLALTFSLLSSYSTLLSLSLSLSLLQNNKLTLSTILQGTVPGGQFGLSVEPIGDNNNDGYDGNNMELILHFSCQLFHFRFCSLSSICRQWICVYLLWSRDG